MNKTKSKEQTNIVLLYGAIWASIILLCLPVTIFSLVAGILFIILLLISYIMKKKFSIESITYNHTSYIIRTLWFGIFILPAVTITIAVIYLLPNYDPTAMNICAIPLAEYLSTYPKITNIETLYKFVYPCIENFKRDNGAVFLISGLITTIPILSYLFYRFVKGTILILKNKHITKPKNWII